MSPDGPSRPREQLNRNLDELLQELRVMQTGVQILTGFLLTVPFTPRFEVLDRGQERLYLAILVLSMLTTVLIVAPVSFHRLLFRQGERDWLVKAAHHCCVGGLLGLGLASCAVIFLVFDLVIGNEVASFAAAAVALAFITVWAVIPFLGRDHVR
jgi:hypothetical protein